MQSWFTPTGIREIHQPLFLEVKVTFYLPQGGFPPSVAQLICTFLTVDKWQMCWAAFNMKPSRELILELKTIYKVSAVYDSSSHCCAGLCPISKSSRTKKQLPLQGHPQAYWGSLQEGSGMLGHWKTKQMVLKQLSFTNKAATCKCISGQRTCR